MERGFPPVPFHRWPRPAIATLAILLVSVAAALWWVRASPPDPLALGASARPLELPRLASTRIPRLGYLSIGDPSQPGMSAGLHRQRFLNGLKEWGYEDGTNLTIEYRFAAGDPTLLPGLAAELVNLPVDLIITADSDSLREVDALTRQIPIIMTTGSDPVATGYAESLAHPGRNLTGLLHAPPEIRAVSLQLLHRTFPSFSRVGIVFQPSTGASNQLRLIQQAALELGLEIIPLEVPDRAGLVTAFHTARAQEVDAVMVLATPFFNTQKAAICALALSLSLPLIGTSDEWADSGALISHSTDFGDIFYRGATYVHQILQGTPPGDLPIATPQKFDLVLNLHTARALGVDVIPRAIVLATRVIQD
jgi:putative tryptophan/tyrosine transport system substrate-binding protein